MWHATIPIRAQAQARVRAQAGPFQGPAPVDYGGLRWLQWLLAAVAAATAVTAVAAATAVTAVAALYKNGRMWGRQVHSKGELEAQGVTRRPLGMT